MRADSSVMDLRMSVETTLPIGGLQFEFRPAGGTQITAIDVRGREATLSFSAMGSTEPQLRVLLVGDEGYLRASTSGALHIRTPGPELRLLITDLTAAESSTSSLQWLDPSELIGRYDVEAVLLARDPSLDARQARMEALGFQPIQDFSSYLLLVR